ncbi:MAG: L,D-transpeptidase family protein [Planctomycetota bacterium]
MPLPSQSSRAGLGGPSRGSVYRGGRRRKRGGLPLPIKAGGGVVALLVAAWIVWMLLPDGDGGPAAANAGEAEIVDPLTTPGPLVIDQGGTREPAPVRAAPSNARPSTDMASADESRSGGGLLGGAIRGTDDSADVMLGGERAGEPTRDPTGTPIRDGRTTNVTVGDDVRTAMETARSRLASNDPLGAREALNAALIRTGRDGVGAGALRAELMMLNDDLVFGPRVLDGDPMSTVYVVQSGDALSRISGRMGEGTHWKLIQRVNRLSSPNRIRVGQSLKVIQGPFHAVVDKSDYRLDLYHGPAENSQNWTYVTSFPVGLGADGSTPSGRFVVRPASKLENPAWVNPRNPSERYSGDDPENPIGEFWVGIDGLGDDAVHTGLGLHGTIEPESIGTQASMGCVRLDAEDVAMVYELLSEGESLVTIVD